MPLREEVTAQPHTGRRLSRAKGVTMACGWGGLQPHRSKAYIPFAPVGTQRPREEGPTGLSRVRWCHENTKVTILPPVYWRRRPAVVTRRPGGAGCAMLQRHLG